MSADATGWVYRHSPYKGVAFTIHHAVADSVNDQHGQRFWLSAEKLAKKARTTRSTAAETLTMLCRDGFLTRVGGGRAAGTSVCYRFEFLDVPVVYESRSTGVPRADTSHVGAGDTGCTESRPRVYREPTLTQENPTGTQGAAPPTGNAPDSRIAALVAGYVDDYRFDRAGENPPTRWKAAAGRAVKEAIRDGRTPDDIARCLGVIARESKNPSTLPHVLADMHAGKERRR